MPYTKQDLIVLYGLSLDEVDQTLTAAEISTEGELYTDEQIQTRFDIVRAYFSNEQVSDYFAAAQLFKQNYGDVQSAAPENSGDDPQLDLQRSNTETDRQPLNLYELLASASSSCGSPIKLNEAIEIFAHCGVAADLEQYTAPLCDRFIYACNLIKKQNKSYEQVAAHFEVGSDLLASERTRDDIEASHGIKASNGIEASIESTATNLDISGNGIVSEVMRSKAKADASAAASMYLQHLSNEFGSAEFQSSWHQMESALKAKVMGKSQQRAKQILGDLRAIPPSTSPLNALPEASNNGSSTS